MRQTIIRCELCGHGLERIRYGVREFQNLCFCTPLIGEPVFREITSPRRLATPGGKLVLRE